MQIGQDQYKTEDQLQGTAHMCGVIWSHGEVRSNRWCQGAVQKLNSGQWHMAFVREYG